ncbi:MAG TPA: hypothetical protein VF843_05560, partial [Streptosporangiaceae bacterium]
MEKRLITGNEAVALGALRAGVKVATGYPGTPSTGCLESLLAMSPMPGRHVEWSVNEKVALEIATGAAWAGQRSLCTMKMSGVNVAYDTLCSVAYSGVVGGLVLYVADDPGASAGMVEQDSRGFALLTDLPMLEAAGVAEAYTLTKAAFELSERTSAPVFVRLVAGIANAYALVEVEAPEPPADRPPVLIHDIDRFTKAGAAIAMTQHYAAIARLEEAGRVVAELKLNRLYLAPRPAPLAVAGGIVVPEPPAVPAPEALPGRFDELLSQAEDQLRQHAEVLPEPVQGLLGQALNALAEARQRRLRAVATVRQQVVDLLRQGQGFLSQAETALGQVRAGQGDGGPGLKYAEELLRLAQQALAAAVPAEPEASEPAAPGPLMPARPVEHPMRRQGLGIIAAGAAAAYVEEGIGQFAGLLPPWDGFGPADVSVLRLAAVNPFPSVEVQAMLRHCGAVIVLEELEPFLEKSVILEAHRLGYDGRIIGKLDGTFSRVGEYGAGQVVKGLATALDRVLPA